MNVKLLRPLAVFVALVSVSGCATSSPPAVNPVVGSYHSERIAENRFVVVFKSNRNIEPRKVRDFALLRAAEIALEYQYTHFVIDRRDDISHLISTDKSDSTTTTTRVVTTQRGELEETSTTDADTPTFKPGARVTIRCFKGPPTDRETRQVFDAAQIVAELKQKYKIG